MGLIGKDLAEILVCPVDKSDLAEDIGAVRLECSECHRRYPVEDGIPIMLADQAEGGPSE